MSTKPLDGPEFELFVKFMRQHPNVWSKVSCPERLSVSGPPALHGEQNAYRDVVPFARRIVETFPDRVLWGTDWPHPNLKDHMPDDGLLVDFIPHIAVTAELQRKLLVDNPRCGFTGRKNCKGGQSASVPAFSSVRAELVGTAQCAPLPTCSPPMFHVNAVARNAARMPPINRYFTA